MNLILDSLYEKMKDINIKIYDSRPTKLSNFPFIIYNVDELSVESNPKIFRLTVDIWTKSNNYKQLEELCSRFNEIMDKKVVSSQGFNYRAIKNSEVRVPDEDLEIKRKRFSYEIRVFEYENI